MTISRLALVGGALAIGLAATAASAATFITEEKADVVLTSPIQDDAYIFGNRVEIEQGILGDAAIFGQVVSVANTIANDLYAAGQIITVSGDIGDDAHLAGNQVQISSRIGGDVFAAGQYIELASTASVGQDVYVAGQAVTIAGTVDGTVRAAADVTVKSGAQVTGDLIAYGNQPVIEDGAEIFGQVQHKVPDQAAKARDSRARLANWVRSVLTLFGIGLLFILALPHFAHQAFDAIKAQPGRSILTSALWLVLAGPAAVLLLISIVGIPLAFGLLLLTPILYIAAAGLAAALVGSWVMSKLSSRQTVNGGALTWPHVLLGAVIYEAVQLLGIIGWLLTFILVLFAFGAIVQTLWANLRTARP
jgi:cytoskeletal protein CcmA (bactofilin family)